MGIWLELGVFGLAFLFAWWQFRDLRRERERREARKRAQENAGSPPADNP